MFLKLTLVLLQFLFCQAIYTVVSTTRRSNLDETVLQAKLNFLEYQLWKLRQRCDTHFQTQTNISRNCKEVKENGHTTSDIYYIQPAFSTTSFPVLCDMTTEGGGWTYFMNRFDGSLNFYVDWNSYKQGFGQLAGEFWLGLEKIHLLTGFEPNELRIELVDWDNKMTYASYNTFNVGNENEGYVLKILEGYKGSAGDAFKNEAGMKFTTKDRDQDQWPEDNCATFSNAGWWYNNCKWAHLTGKYFKDNKSGNDYLKGIYWTEWHGNRYSLKQVRMMVRPRSHTKATLAPSNKFK